MRKIIEIPFVTSKYFVYKVNNPSKYLISGELDLLAFTASSWHYRCWNWQEHATTNQQKPPQNIKRYIGKFKFKYSIAENYQNYYTKCSLTAVLNHPPPSSKGKTKLDIKKMFGLMLEMRGRVSIWQQVTLHWFRINPTKLGNFYVYREDKLRNVFIKI